MTNDPEEGSVQYIILLPVQSSGILLSELNKNERETQCPLKLYQQGN